MGGARLSAVEPGGHDSTMANRPFTLTTAAGLGLLFALQADAGQANVSLATGSAAPAATTASVTEAATTAAASIVLEAQTPPPAAAPAPAPEEPAPSVTGGVNVDLFSHYVWRGFALTDGFAFQPSVFVSTHGLTFTSWSSWSSTDAGCFDPDDCPALREHDFTVDYTKPVGSATVSVGYINYLFPPYRTDEAKAADAVGATNELYARRHVHGAGQPVREVLLRRGRRRHRHLQGHLHAVRRQPADPAGRGQGDAHADVLGRLQLGRVDRGRRLRLLGPGQRVQLLERREPRRQAGDPGGQVHDHPGHVPVDRAERHGEGDRLRRRRHQVLRRRRLLVRVLEARLRRGYGGQAPRDAPPAHSLYCSAGSRGGPADVRTSPLRRRPSRPTRRVRAGPGHLDPAFLQYRRRLPVHVPAGHRHAAADRQRARLRRHARRLLDPARHPGGGRRQLPRRLPGPLAVGRSTR